ncbi:hypothetical protein H744_2c2165 [Photobacterium gaetbulicola Gung47]|uniref:DUF3179 domain-containing protein n=1 Tax=Photobacterium gaetbulicola Gung47 TaxID=658445 RepID=A0A0C5WUU2_9GAMM|nr:DUF3179 domain-containing (seleno)protein [Photobacterium gaetbulicola]AJR08829.1 hypothetical protein H744_2c2165 [Photobacterium gaetbulicola Gung47]
MSDSRKVRKIHFYIVAIVTAFFSIFSAVVMTEPGQSLNLPRSWTVAYYHYSEYFIALNMALLAYLWYLHTKAKLWTNRRMRWASKGVLVCIISANFLLSLLFPPRQTDAIYMTVAQANNQLRKEEIIYAVEINGDVRGFPRSHLGIPHIAGDTIGGEEVAMTFCGLSNLPVVIDQDIGHGEKADLGILIQTHNNLVMVERNSGDLIQQITMETEFSESDIKQYPNTMMTWEAFKEIYPDAEVFIYPFDRWMDKLLVKAFDKPMEKQFDPERGAIFPTLDMADERLNAKEQVWGLNSDGKQIAFTHEFAKQNPVYEFEMAGKPYVLVYSEEYDIVNLFSLEKEGLRVTFGEINFKGETDSEWGRLEQVPTQNGIFWMVWSHWFPETKLMS